MLEPHLDREIRDATPVTAQALPARDWNAWNQTYNIGPKSPRQPGLEGRRLPGQIDPEDYQVVVSTARARTARPATPA